MGSSETPGNALKNSITKKEDKILKRS